jgi:hypothetical protein
MSMLRAVEISRRKERKMNLIHPSNLRKYSDEEVEQAILMLRTKGDQFYCDLLRSILSPDPEGINPPVQFFAYVANSGLMAEHPTIELSILKGKIYTHIQLNRHKYLIEMEKISSNLKEK